MQLVYNQSRINVTRIPAGLLLMANDPNKMTVKEVCAYLEISRTTLYALEKSEDPPFTRLPPNPIMRRSTVYYSRAEVLAAKERAEALKRGGG